YRNPLDPTQKLSLYFAEDSEAKTRLDTDVRQFNIENEDYQTHMTSLAKWNRRSALLSNPVQQLFGSTAAAVHIAIDGQDDMNLTQLAEAKWIPNGLNGSEFYR